ncbi:MAG: type I pullulanase [Tissierellia bacterium]|nr:type I pullulanase [Tissierellia bacterium]
MSKNKYYSYNRYGLGAEYSKEKTEFRIWSNEAKNISLQLYKNEKDIPYRIEQMKDEGKGFFATTIYEDLDGIYYDYLIDEELVANDIYAKASSINSIRSCVVNLEDTDPPGFRYHNIPYHPWKDAIIYEMCIKDFTADPSSGVRRDYRGKFLGACEENTGELVTGIDHVADLGVTHVHLMPVYDFWTVDERPERFFDGDNYNWGYDPENYNVIEGSYGTDPYDPKNRIREFKKMIQKYHERGISVVMDVVYNHTYRTVDSNFNKLMPDYYYRKTLQGEFSNGSGCGNEAKTENKMVREFILDSLLYYMKEYKIDGFRFDLMALMDRKTMDDIVRVLRWENPEVLIYGEPWSAFASTLPKDQMVITGSQYGKEFSIFNSGYRDALKGDNDGAFQGYIQGEYGYKREIETGIAGSIHFDEYHRGFAKDPWESINYFNSHDNLIIQDKLTKTMKDQVQVADRTKLLFNLLMTSFGIPFFHAGNEFLRSKKMRPNTYHSPLEVNGIDWRKKMENMDIFEHVRDLIAFRRQYRRFFSYDGEELPEHLGFMGGLKDSLIAYGIFNGMSILLFFHNMEEEEVLSMEEIKTLIQRRGNYKIHNFIKIYENRLMNKKMNLKKKIRLKGHCTTIIKAEVNNLDYL